MSSNQMKGIVCGILSGDSLVVRFVGAPTQVVCLEHLVAPKFGRIDGKVQDEPFGYESWDFLRNLCIGKRVLVNESRPTTQMRIHPAFGQLPVIFTRVFLVDAEEDVGLAACTAGWVKMRDQKNLTEKVQTGKYMSDLAKVQEEAQEKRIGIWCGKEGTVRRLPVRPANVEKVLSKKVLECNIDGIKNATTFSLLIIPTHETFYLTLAGCRSAKFNDDSPYREQSKINTRNKFLNRKVKVRIFQSADFGPNEIPTFTGCFLDEKMDKAIADSIEKGYAIFNKKNADYIPNPELYIMKQIIAQKAKAGYWETQEFQIPQQTEQFKGIVSSIKGSNCLYVLDKGQSRPIILNNVKVPYFSTNHGCQPCGYEAREFLRKMFYKKLVTVEVDGVYEDHYIGTILLRNVSANEMLCEEGLAQMMDPICGIPSSRVKQIKEAEEKAKRNKLGIWADNKPEEFKFVDYTYQKYLGFLQNELKGKKFQCIIEYIISSSRFTILIPENRYLLRVSLNGLLSISSQDKFGKDAKQFCRDNLLQTEAEVEFIDLDEHSGYFWVSMHQNDVNKTNIATKILESGYSLIPQKIVESVEIPREFVEAQEIAKARMIGIWSDRTRHQFALEKRKSYPVIVTSVINPLKIVIQHSGPEMKMIKEQLVNLATEPITEVPLKNECVAYRYENNIFRARVENANAGDNQVKIYLIDYEQATSTSMSNLFKLPDSLTTFPPQGRTVTLAGLNLIEKPKEQEVNDTDIVWNTIKDAVLYMHLCNENNGEDSVVLLDREQVNGAASLGIVLIQNNIATYAEVEYPSYLKPIFDQLKDTMKVE